ncbi:N-acetylmuramoyl-L-alanine amidase [Elusimicrobiota bacterium]
MLENVEFVWYISIWRLAIKKIIAFKLILVLLACLVCAERVDAKKFVLVLDPGHMPIEGKTGPISPRGVPERDYNFQITNRLIEKLDKLDWMKVVLTNKYNEVVELKRRPEIANEHEADLFLSVHHDGAQSQFFEDWEGGEHQRCNLFSGYSILLSKTKYDRELKKHTKDPYPYYKESRCFANQLGKQFEARGFKPTHHHTADIPGERRKLISKRFGIYNIPVFAVFKYNERPAVLVECGVIVNSDEELRLSKPETQIQIVDALYETIMYYVDECWWEERE